MDEKFDSFFNSIDRLPKPESREKIIIFLKEQSELLQNFPDAAPKLAYKIAGLLATDYSRSLDDNDPINEILFLAGNLETNPDNADELRTVLMRKIAAL